MAATGTGTQSDPYIVDNIDDLFTYAAMAGVYVGVDGDINVQTYDAYARGIDRPLIIKCAKLFGVRTGVRTAVKGLVIGQGAANFIKSEVASGSTCTMERLEFTGGVFTRKRDGTGADLLLTNISLENCGFSYECRQAEKTGAAALSGGDLNGCYVYINGTQPLETVTAQTHNVLFYPNSATGCNFEAHGMHVYSRSGALPMIANGFKCLYLLEGCRLYHDEGYPLYIADDLNTCAIAVSQSKADSTALTVSDKTAAFGTLAGVNIIDKDLWKSIEANGFSLPADGDVPYLYQLETTQMKSRDYLQSIGFLP